MTKRVRNARGELLEAGFQEQVVGLARIGGWRFFHAPNGARGGGKKGPRVMAGGQYPEGRGFPDLVLVRGTESLYRELKTDTGRMGPGQQDWLDALQAAGHDVGVWRPRDIDLIKARLLAPRPTTTTGGRA
jgi:hypothetical protein